MPLVAIRGQHVWAERRHTCARRRMAGLGFSHPHSARKLQRQVEAGGGRSSDQANGGGISAICYVSLRSRPRCLHRYSSSQRCVRCGTWQTGRTYIVPWEDARQCTPSPSCFREERR
ncbi:hypothetical protein L226DRAFT_310466 [Lentinus tigrinus ALCF2SS1-7]|uniref:uncharacterized protein n=1 Tax=Lentinus tigrinus ALCF2SS1-7 TaxID=1328758 RepID=UPI001165F29F|nr:hypothetical protein L226DRAFT_310466 [Lentinus tigrinus ALCF2SS1-7]